MVGYFRDKTKINILGLYENWFLNVFGVAGGDLV